MPRRWNKNLKTMPANGRFEALRSYDTVYRHLPDRLWVIEPTTGKMFRPVAWRKATGKRKAKTTA